MSRERSANISLTQTYLLRHFDTKISIFYLKIKDFESLRVWSLKFVTLFRWLFLSLEALMQSQIVLDLCYSRV
jgi:hypothetical protein